MKEGYRLLGDFIQPVDERNRDLKVDYLLGVSISKQFIPSIANIVGTDLSSYKIVRTGQFAYGPVTSRNGEKISIALLQDKDCIISSSYTVFEVTDNERLDPEYLMLWFSRPEFDRYTRYMSHGSVREIFDWDELCKVELPVPSIEKQRGIVKAYNTITDRIELKRKINDNLVTSGIAAISSVIGKAALINATEADLLRLNLSENYSVKTVSEYCSETKSGSTPSRTVSDYWLNGTIPWVKSGEVHNNITLQTEERITQSGLEGSSAKLLPIDTVLMAMYGVTAGEVGYLGVPATTNQAICGMVCHSRSEAAYLYFALIQSQSEISRLSNGGAQDNLSKNFIDGIKLIVPTSETLKEMRLPAFIDQMMLNTREIALLEDMQATLLAQLSSR
jgi:type I restriction enzyme S subunit